jgi:hypothetical protein
MKQIRKIAAALGLLLMLGGCGQTQEIQTPTEIMTDTDGATLVEVTWQTPELKGILQGSALQTVQQYYDGLYAESQIDWKGSLKEQAAQQRKQAGKDFLPYQIDETCEITADTETYLSVQRHVTQFTGGSQEGILIYGETFRKADGTLVLLSDLFQEGADYTEKLFSEIRSQIQKNSQVAYYENAAEQAKIGLEENPTYYLTENQLVLVCQAGELAPYAEGPQIFFIPLSDLQDVLTEE